jgi:hypothetical protein
MPADVAEQDLIILWVLVTVVQNTLLAIVNWVGVLDSPLRPATAQIRCRPRPRNFLYSPPAL